MAAAYVSYFLIGFGFFLLIIQALFGVWHTQTLSYLMDTYLSERNLLSLFSIHTGFSVSRTAIPYSNVSDSLLVLLGYSIFFVLPSLIVLHMFTVLWQCSVVLKSNLMNREVRETGEGGLTPTRVRLRVARI